MWTRHVLNCAVLGELIEPSARVVDVGSGAGLPGLAVAVARPDLTVTLVEPLERRVAWLQQVVADLALDVRVRRARAEDVVGQVSGGVVTARAVAPLPRLLRWALPLVDRGGRVLAIKGRTADAELAASSDVLARWRITGAEVVTCGAGLLDVPTTVVHVPGGRRPDD
jgi:16S rRNA (guanine527-N7)-methyltransferase